MVMIVLYSAKVCEMVVVRVSSNNVEPDVACCGNKTCQNTANSCQKHVSVECGAGKVTGIGSYVK